MLSPDPDEIMRSARWLVLRYGPHAADMAREQAASRTASREQDVALLVLSAVERITMAGRVPPSH
jgi:hypothetical protein